MRNQLIIAVACLAVSSFVCAGDVHEAGENNPYLGKQILPLSQDTKAALKEMGAGVITVETTKGTVLLSIEGKEILPCANVDDGKGIGQKCGIKNGVVEKKEVYTITQYKQAGDAHAVKVAAPGGPLQASGISCSSFILGTHVYTFHNGGDQYPFGATPCHDGPH